MTVMANNEQRTTNDDDDERTNDENDDERTDDGDGDKTMMMMMTGGCVLLAPLGSCDVVVAVSVVRSFFVGGVHHQSPSCRALLHSFVRSSGRLVVRSFVCDFQRPCARANTVPAADELIDR